MAEDPVLQYYPARRWGPLHDEPLKALTDAGFSPEFALVNIEYGERKPQ